MWIFTPDAFLSVVANRDDEATLLVRARAAGDIERVFPDAAVAETPEADYRFRAAVPRGHVGRVLALMAEEVGYDNFKKEVAEHDRHDAYLRVWSAMHAFQTRRAWDRDDVAERLEMSGYYAAAGDDECCGFEPVDLRLDDDDAPCDCGAPPESCLCYLPGDDGHPMTAKEEQEADADPREGEPRGPWW